MSGVSVPDDGQALSGTRQQRVIVDPLRVEAVQVTGSQVWMVRCRLCSEGHQPRRFDEDQDGARAALGKHCRSVHGVPPWPAQALPGHGVEHRLWTETSQEPGSITLGAELVEALAGATGVHPATSPSMFADALRALVRPSLVPAPEFRRSRTDEVRRDAVARDRDLRGLDGAADDADVRFGERITVDRSFPVPVLVELCGLCGEPWSEHEQQALRRSTTEETPPVELIDCVRTQAVAAQGPPGPVGAKGERGEPGATGARGQRGPAGGGGGWSGPLP